MKQELIYTDNIFEGLHIWNKVQELNAEQTLVESDGNFFIKNKYEIISKEKYDEFQAKRRKEKKELLSKYLASSYIDVALAKELLEEIGEEGEIDEK